MTITMYGIRNCDTVRKARVWLDGCGVDYRFHDFKTAGIDRARLEAWCRGHGWEVVLNRAGTTFRKLAATRTSSLTEQKALLLMLEQPSMIKRPVLEVGPRSLVGFSTESYERLFPASRIDPPE